MSERWRCRRVAAQQIVGPEPREASFASSVIRRSCSVAPWPGQLNRWPSVTSSMKKFLLLAVVLGTLAPCAAQRQFVAFENVRPEYKSLADVRPIVANRGRQRIYLWPQNCGQGLVSWLQQDGYWYDSDRKPCRHSSRPIILKPGQTYRLPPLVIRMDLIDHFYENRVAKPGKFKITMYYSFRPVYRHGPPQLRETVAQEFSIVP
jgi:hypothetical protein